MRFINDPNDYPEALALWLLAATKGLRSMEDIDRIKAEILAHFHDAFAAGLDAGLSAAEAERQAIAGLGDPKAARRKYRKAYNLCCSGREQLDALKKASRTPKQVIGLVIVWILFVVVLISMHLYSWWSGKAGEAGLFHFYFLPLLMISSELFPSLHARFILNALRKGSERALKKTVILFDALATFTISLVMLGYFIFLMRLPGGHLISAVIATITEIVMLTIGVLSIKRDLLKYGSMLRKISRQELSLDEPVRETDA